MNTPKSRDIPVNGRTILHFASNMSQLSNEAVDPPLSPSTRIENEPFKIRFASNDEHRQSATFLVEKLYGSRDYKTDEDNQSTEPQPDAIALLVQNKENETVGTITLGPDGPAGLLGQP